MEDFGHFWTEFVQFWSNLGHFWTESLLSDYFYTLNLLLEPVFVIESTFSMEKFSRFAVDFQQKDQDASRARISSWSGL